MPRTDSPNPHAPLSNSQQTDGEKKLLEIVLHYIVLGRSRALLDIHGNRTLNIVTLPAFYDDFLALLLFKPWVRTYFFRFFSSILLTFVINMHRCAIFFLRPISTKSARFFPWLISNTGFAWWVIWDDRGRDDGGWRARSLFRKNEGEPQCFRFIYLKNARPRAYDTVAFGCFHVLVESKIMIYSCCVPARSLPDPTDDDYGYRFLRF